MDSNNVENTKKTTKKKVERKVDKKSPNNMEGRKKIFIALIVIVLLLVVILVVLPLFKKDIKISSKDKISEEKTFENYKIKETTISYEDETTVFDTKIENISSDIVPARGLNIILLDKDGNEITSIGVYLKDMQAGEVIDTKAVISEKIENIYDLKIISDQTVTNEDVTENLESVSQEENNTDDADDTYDTDDNYVAE